MTSLKEFFNKHEDDIQKGITHKNNIIKRNIVAYMAVNGCSTLAELTQKLHVSVPTMTKLVNELVNEKLVVENGKIETTGGRRPNVFGLTNSAIYFAGVNIGRDSIQFVLSDVQNKTIYESDNHDFILTDSDKCLRQICELIDGFLNTCGVERSKILGIGVCIAGRVNPDTGRSYMYFTSSDKSLRETIEEYTKIRTLVENDTRARCYAEYCNDNQQSGHNLLYLHLGRGVAIGIVTNGKLYYGKSGFAGEFGHTPFFDNEIICACGKKGCLETEVSGMAIEQKIVHRIEQGVNTILREKYDAGQTIHIDDVVNAAKKDDTLSIELIEEAGEKVGKSIAFLINIFNPETVIIGGNLSKAGEFLMLPLKSATNKFSLNLVYKDTKFRFSQMSENAGALGAAMLIRNRIIGVQ